MTAEPNARRPLAGITSIRVKLGLLVVASTVAVLVVAAIGRRAGVPTLVSGPVTIAAALGATRWLARGMVTPLQDMTRAASRMAGGQWSERIDVTSADEVGTLARSFNAMAEDLATQDEQRRALIATVSHELRTPLAAQRAVLENLADGVVAPDERTLGTALAQAERLSDLVNDLLDLSRIDGGAGRLALARVDVAQLLIACVAEAELRPRDVRHVVTVTPESLSVTADRARLTQVIVNLLDNADRHSPAGGVVRVDARVDGSDWVLDVRDDGPGIPPEQRHRIFQRFGSTDPTSGGSGLGLAIARWVVEMHGGRIDALDAEAGAHLALRLPRTPVFPSSKPSPSPAASADTPAPRAAAAPAVVAHAATGRHTPSSSPTQESTMSSAVAPTVPSVPSVPPAAPRPDFWGRFWPERHCGPQVAILAAAAGVGIIGSVLLPLMNGVGLAVSLVMGLGGSLAFVVGRAWRSPWALAVWALCLVAVSVFTLRAEPGLAVLGLVLATPLFMSAFTKARTIVGLLISGLAWVLAAIRGLPLLGRTLGRLSARRNLWAVLRAGALTVLGVIVFGALFASADAIVGSWAKALVPDWQWSELTLRAFLWTFITGLTLTACYVALNPPAADPDPDLALTPRPAKHRFEWLVPAGAVLVLFVVFLAAQASALFGGKEHVLRTTGLTYAEYARQGFGQLVVVTLLTTVVLALIRWFASEQTAADRSIKRGVVLTMTALSLLVVGSALHRLWLYQEAYGFTTARITAALAEGWLALVVILVGAAAAGWSWAWAARVALFSASALAVALPLVNLDARVVELNAARYEATGKVDVDYLSQLAPDGSAAIVANFPREMAACALTGTSTSTDDSWTSWNLGRERMARAQAQVGTPTGVCPTAYR